jgi:hypothetical protein
VRDGLGAEYGEQRRQFHAAKEKGEPLDALIADLRPRYKHLMRIIEYMNKFYPDGKHKMRLSDFDLAIPVSK